ncbi:hypothetical protein A8B78_05070 [Jannaschia sp. EhC01]|nr:hypothetical protein A8B78_05070 [Jannaschia sp. EhC01]
MMGLRKPASKYVTELLEAQHNALLRGDLDVLGRMAPELERAFTRLGQERGAIDTMEQIKRAAARNARLLKAAQAGVSSARARLTASRSPELTTYGADGQSKTGAPATGRTFARR